MTHMVHISPAASVVTASKDGKPNNLRGTTVRVTATSRQFLREGHLRHFRNGANRISC
jgi:hypothetical protein